MYGQITAAIIGLLIVRWWSRHTHTGIWTRYFVGRFMYVFGVIIIIVVMLPMRLFPQRRRFNTYQATDYQATDYQIHH